MNGSMNGMTRQDPAAGHPRSEPACPVPRMGAAWVTGTDSVATIEGMRS
jgi:hypothetical protein